MSEGEEALSTFLEAVAAAAREIELLLAAVRQRRDVESATSRLDCRSYSSAVSLEAYVDAELVSGDSLCWWLEVTRRDSEWALEASVRLTTSSGQDSLWEYEIASHGDWRSVVAGLPSAAQELARTSLLRAGEPL